MSKESAVVSQVSDNSDMSGISQDDIKYMQRALELAKKGEGWVNPNPMVGAVIVKDGRVIGEGYHRKYGELHAERNALANLTEPADGATIYVTLEPCCHYGKTPPCTEALIENNIKRVVIGSKDNNPLVGGKGIEILKQHGMQVQCGVLEDECRKLNEVFFHNMVENTPFVVMKYASTIDGKIATHKGLSQWITGEEARRNVHKDRNKYMAIMVGIGTVIADDPLLTCRIEKNGHQVEANNPIRIICDTHLRTPLDCKLVTTADKVKTIIATCEKECEKHKAYIKAGVEVLVVPSVKEDDKDQVDLKALMKMLKDKKIDSVLLEGGATLNWAALKAGIVNKVQAYIAPKMFGGVSSKTPVGGIGVDAPDDAFILKRKTITPLGDDILVEGYL